MEVIPILSTIILVATISTFIIAIGAYILFKVQEKRADQFIRRGHETDRAESVDPAIVGEHNLSAVRPDGTQVITGKQQPETSTVQQSTISKLEQKSKEALKKKKPTGSKFMKFDSLGYRSIDDDKKRIITWR